MENQSGSVLVQVLLETSLMLSHDKNAESQNTALDDTTTNIPPESLPDELAFLDNNNNVSSLNLLSSQKSVPETERPEANLGVPSKKQNSVPSSRSSRKRLELENEIMEDEARADIEGKQQNLKLRPKRREMEIELEAKKKEKGFVEVIKQKELSLKLETSSNGSVCSASGSLRVLAEKTS